MYIVITELHDGEKLVEESASEREALRMAEGKREECGRMLSRAIVVRGEVIDTVYPDNRVHGEDNAADWGSRWQ